MPKSYPSLSSFQKQKIITRVKENGGDIDVGK